MKTLRVVIFSFMILASPHAFAGAKAVSNPLFSYTHMLPSPYTMPAGVLYIGTDAAIGVTDFMEVGTSIIRDVYQTYNAGVKFQLIDTPSFAAGLTGSWVSYTQSNQQITILSPGLVTAYGLSDSLAWYLGGNVNFTNVTVNYSSVATSSLYRGTVLDSDIAWAYSGKKKNSMGNVLAAGVTYDVSYNMWGVGLSHYWGGFRLGFHYYPTASTYPIYPLISGSTVVNF